MKLDTPVNEIARVKCPQRAMRINKVSANARASTEMHRKEEKDRGWLS